MGTAHADGGPSSSTLHRFVETGSIYCVVEKLLLRGLCVVHKAKVVTRHPAKHSV